MKHLSKWFIATLAGVALFSSSCVDQVKFGDSFLEKAPGVAVTQDTIFGKATYARAFLWNTYTLLRAPCILEYGGGENEHRNL